jgi:uncharacterized protein YjbJ (UPF0337 family)
MSRACLEKVEPIVGVQIFLLGERLNSTRSLVMGSTSDKVKGKANEVAGKARQAIGKAVGNHEEQAKGKIQETKGKAQVAKGQVKDAVKNLVDKA